MKQILNITSGKVDLLKAEEKIEKVLKEYVNNPEINSLVELAAKDNNIIKLANNIIERGGKFSIKKDLSPTLKIIFGNKNIKNGVKNLLEKYPKLKPDIFNNAKIGKPV